jgi:V/A-type H+-transporting ATPase subunit E
VIDVATVDDKLKLFAKIIFEKVQKDSEQKVLDFSGEQDQYLETEKKNLLKLSESIVSQAKKKAEIKKNQVISKANIDGQHELLKRKKIIFDQTVEDIKKMADEYTLKPEYAVYLEKSISTGLSRINSNEVYIFLKNRDLENYKDKINEIVNKYKKPGMNVVLKEAASNILGGCICEDKDRTLRVDCSMLTVIEDNRGLIGKELLDNLQ